MEERADLSNGRWHNNRRGLGTIVAAIIMVVVLAVVGAGAYFAFTGTTTNGSSGSTSVQSCEPKSSPLCGTLSGGHDLFLSTAFRTSQTGIPNYFTAGYSGGQKISYYLFNFGDGTTQNSTVPSVSHTYLSPGSYLSSVQAKVSGSNILHDSYKSLLLLNVAAASSSSISTEVPRVSGVITANQSTAVNPTAVLPNGGAVNVSGSYVGTPSDPNSIPIQPSLIVSSGGSVSHAVTTTTSASGNFTFSTPGVNWITFVGGGQVGSTTYYQNYTWSVFVAQAGFSAGWVTGGGSSGGGGGGGSFRSQHPGTLSVYELVPGGSYSEDPALDYETAGYEPIVNVYQTLIFYNGSETGTTYTSYVPQVAACVPGSPTCTSLFGNGFTGISSDAKNYTFVIGTHSQFYDPVSGKNWGVYPSDVVFSVARTMAFATLPCVGCNNGWILSQALLSAGNGTWDSIHGAMNNTPQNVFASMSVNDSQWCPAAAMTNYHGCVTFHANANGVAWPYFMELIADNLGASITPCGWFSASPQDAGVPGWTNGTISGAGDQPCTLPGGVTTTNSSAFTSAVAAMPPKSWDSWETLGSGGNYVGNVQWNMAGSGPYYMKQINPGTSYLLQANPAFQPECTWTGCQPAAGTYAKTVNVLWESTPTQGEQAYKAGIADFASVPTTDLSFLLSMVNAGGVQLVPFGSLSIYFFPFNTAFDVAGAQSLVPATNVPSTWYSYVGMRQFIANAYPYATIQNTINTKNGIVFDLSYGGAIPHGMANFYQGNISWPAGDPNGSATGSASWWWTQITTPSSPFYDPQTAACSSSTPCVVPLIGQTGAPDLDQRIAALGASVAKLSGGAVEVQSADVNFGTLVGDSLGKGPYNNPLPLYQLGWAPDYPDPTDYVAPLYAANGTYTAGDTVYQQLTNYTQGFSSASCHSSSDYGYWAIQGRDHNITNGCQGAAYIALQFAMAAAAVDPNVNTRVFTYWQAESIANGLALYVYWGQSNIVESMASYLNGNSVNQNVVIGGGNTNTWYTVTYASSGNGVSD